MEEMYFGIQLTYKLPSIINNTRELCRSLILSTLLNIEEIEDLINRKLPVMKDHEITKINMLLSENVKETQKLFSSFEGNYKGTEVYDLLINKLTQLEERIQLTELVEIANHYSITKADLLRSLGSKAITPKGIYNYLCEYVVGQDAAKRSAAYLFYNHLLRIGFLGLDVDASKMPHTNLLLVGPTGSGKTLIVKLLSELFDLPYVIINSSSVTASGYYGESIDDALTSLILKAKGDINIAETGIVVFDEIDKIADRRDEHISTISVQHELLSIVEGACLDVPINKSRNADKAEINTSKICFLFSGAFVGIDLIKNRRKSGGNAIGFNSITQKNSNTCDNINESDLIEFGIIPELVGRINIITELQPLTVEDVKKIMGSIKNSSLSQFIEYFRIHNITITLDDELLSLISEKAISKGLGARALNNILRSVFEDLLFNAPYLVNQTIAFTHKEHAAKILNL